MDKGNHRRPAFLKTFPLMLILFASPAALAFVEFVNEQSAGNISALIYALLGVMSLLFITPLLQFYFGALRTSDNTLILQQHFRALETTGAGIIYLEEKGKISFANSTAKQLLGSEDMDLIGNKITDLLDENSVDEFEKMFVDDRGDTSDIVVHVQHTPVHLFVSDSVRQDGKVFRIVTLKPLTRTGTDASAVLEPDIYSPQQSAPEDQENRLKALLEESPVGIGKINSKQEILWANQSLIKRLKYSEDELKKGNLFKLFRLAKDASLVSQTLEGERKVSSMHVDLVTKDGGVSPTELTIEANTAGQDEQWFWMVDYWDEQFQYDKFNALLETGDNPVAILTEQGFTKLNKKAYKFLQLDDSAELKGLFPYSQAFNTPQTDTEQLQTLIETTRRKGGIASLPWSHLIDDEAVPCEITLVPVYKRNELDSILCVWTDLRELENAGAALKATKSELARTRQENENKDRQLQKNRQALARLDETNRALAQSKSRVSQLESKYSDSLASNDALEARCAELEAGRTKLEQQYEAQASELSEVSQSLAEQESQHQEQARALEKAQSEIDVQQTLLIERDNRITFLESDRESEQTEVSALLSQIKSLKETIYKRDQTIEVLEYQTRVLESEQENSATFIDKLMAQVSALQGTDAVATSETANHPPSHSSKPDFEHPQRQDMTPEKNTELANTKVALEKAQQHVMELSNTAQRLELENKQHDDIIDNLMAQVADLKVQTKQQEARLADNDLQLQQTQTESQQKQQSLEDLLAQEKQVSERLQDELKNDHGSQIQLKEMQAEIARLEKDFTASETQRSSLEMQLTEHKNSAQDYKERLDAAEAEQQKTKDKLHAVEKHAESFIRRAQESKNEATFAEPASFDSRPALDNLSLPNRPVSWFDLNHFWSQQPADYRLSLSLNALLDEIDAVISKGDLVTQLDEMAEMTSLSQQLLKVSKMINAEQLTDLAQSLNTDCLQGMDENARIRWQPTRHALQNSQRVVYEQLQHM